MSSRALKPSSCPDELTTTNPILWGILRVWAAQRERPRLALPQPRWRGRLGRSGAAARGGGQAAPQHPDPGGGRAPVPAPAPALVDLLGSRSFLRRNTRGAPSAAPGRLALQAAAAVTGKEQPWQPLPIAPAAAAALMTTKPSPGPGPLRVRDPAPSPAAPAHKGRPHASRALGVV